VPEKVRIIDFAESRGLKANTVTAWIVRQKQTNPELWGKALLFEGKEQFILPETEAFELLERKYPFPKPVEVISRDPADVERIDRLQEENKQLALRLAAQAEAAAQLHDLIAEQKGQLVLLEVREQERDAARETAERFENALQKAGEENAVLSAEKGRLEEEKRALEEKLREAEDASKKGFFAFRKWRKSRREEQ